MSRPAARDDEALRRLTEAAAWRVRLTEDGADTSEAFEDWLAKDGTISREVPLVKTKEGDYLFDSGELPVAESLLERVNTGGKVTIRIVYTLHKDPK